MAKYYCPYCSNYIASLSVILLDDYLACLSCRHDVRGSQLLEKPLSIDTIQSLLNDKDRYERFRYQHPEHALKPCREELTAYLTACILGEA